MKPPRARFTVLLLLALRSILLLSTFVGGYLFLLIRIRVRRILVKRALRNRLRGQLPRELVELITADFIKSLDEAFEPILSPWTIVRELLKR